MADDDGLEGINPLMAHAVEQVTRATADAFLKIWTGPRAADTMERFLSGEVVFVVCRHELMVLQASGVLAGLRDAPAEPPEPPPPGQYL
jgi:hypothetical protein